MQMGFYFDQKKCVGCWACDFVCKNAYSLNHSVHRRRITIVETPELVTYVSVSCMHCEDPPCVDACPAAAIEKRESDGLVIVDQGACLGKDSCGALCFEACPYDAPQFADESDAKMDKCDMCLDKVQGGEIPYCVNICNHAALDFGPMEELKKKYGDKKTAVGFEYSEEAKPSILLSEGSHEYLQSIREYIRSEVNR